jgi:hypothetical protein
MNVVPPIRRWLLLLALPLIGWAGAVTWVWWNQERLLFAPTVLPADEPLHRAPQVYESFVAVPGARLSLLELRLPAPSGVVFFLHGNGGSLREWFVDPSLYREANFDLVMMDYRGYGKSSGAIDSETALHDDVRRVWAHVAPRYRELPIVVYGRSLGTALAAHLAAEIQPDLTVLVSPYRSMAALAQHYYPWLPSAAIRYPLRTDKALAGIEGPVLLFHGEHDSLIPIEHSRSLAADHPSARLVVVPRAAHDDVHAFDTYKIELRGALAALAARSSTQAVDVASNAPGED